MGQDYSGGKNTKETAIITEIHEKKCEFTKKGRITEIERVTRKSIEMRED